jgi:hypothetical protein
MIDRRSASPIPSSAEEEEKSEKVNPPKPFAPSILW